MIRFGYGPEPVHPVGTCDECDALRMMEEHERIIRKREKSKPSKGAGLDFNLSDIR